MKTNAQPPSIDQARIDQIIGLLRSALGWAVGFIAAFEVFGTPRPLERWLRGVLFKARACVTAVIMLKAERRVHHRRRKGQRFFVGMRRSPRTSDRRRCIGSILRRALRARGLRAGFAKLLAALDNNDALVAAFAKRLTRGSRTRLRYALPAFDALISEFASHLRSPELVEGSAAPPFS